MGFLSSLSFPLTLCVALSLSEVLVEPIAMAYLLCIIGCSVPEDWLGREESWETRGEEKEEARGGWGGSRDLLILLFWA